MIVLSLLGVLCWGAWCLMGTTLPEGTSERTGEEKETGTAPGLRGPVRSPPVARVEVAVDVPSKLEERIPSAEDLLATLAAKDAAFVEAGTDLTIEMSGRVFNPDGTPCDGANVDLYRNGLALREPLASTSTLPDGSWRIATVVRTHLPPRGGFWWRLCSGQGGDVTRTHDEWAWLGQLPDRVVRKERMNFYLRRRSEVRLHVVDAAGVEIAGASCVLGMIVQKTTLPAVLTDASGRATVRLLSSHRQGHWNHELRVTHPGFAYAHVYVPRDQRELRVVLKRASALRGTLVGAFGNPLPDLAFGVVRYVPFRLTEVPLITTTDAHGRFELADYAAAGDQITVTADGYAPLVVDVTSDAAELTWQLTPSPRPYRWLLLKERETGRWLNILDCDADWGEEYHFLGSLIGSDIPDPRIAIGGLAPRTWGFAIRVVGFPDTIFRHLHLDADSPEIVVLEVDRPPGLQVHGTLKTREGTPVGGVTGSMSRVLPDREGVVVTTDTNGQFTAFGLSGGQYAVEFASDDFAAVRTLVRVSDGDQPTLVDLIAGPGATIVVRRPPSVRRAGCTPASGAQQHLDGITRLHRVPPGEVSVGLIGTGMSEVTYWTESAKTIHVAHGQQMEVDLRSTPLGRVFGRVVGPDHEPRRNVRVGLGALHPFADGSESYRTSRITDGEGRFAFESVVPGRYVVLGIDDDFKQVVVIAVAGSGEELVVSTSK